MYEPFSPESRRDLIRRGFSRRDFGKLAALLTAGAALPFYNEAALAQGLSALPNLPPDAVRINANENPMGPCPAAIEAIQKIVPQGGRYLYQETGVFSATMAEVEGIPRESRHAVRRVERSPPSRRAGLHRARQELCHGRSRLRSGRAGCTLRRSQDDFGPAAQRLLARRQCHGAGRPRSRLDLRLQPQQSHRLDHLQGRHRIPGRAQAERHDRAARRGLYPPLEKCRTGFRAGRGRQGL